MLSMGMIAHLAFPAWAPNETKEALHPLGQKLAQRTARHTLGYGESSDIAALRQRKREMVDRYQATGDEVARPSRPHSFLEIDLRR